MDSQKNIIVRLFTHFRTRRNYKDTLFLSIFRSKEALLSLYNALNHTDHSNENDLMINTLDDCLYLGYKNDISFLVGDYMNLYENQSTFCKNMPIRGLIYFSGMYKAYIDSHKMNMYGTELLKLPTPKYIVFYNGTDPVEDMVKLRLSDSFSQGDGCIEVTATMYNINYGHNRELMESCRLLHDYSVFIATVRKNLKKRFSRDEAIALAIDECIEKDILREFLLKHRAEVASMFYVDFHPELQREFDREEGYAKGLSEGLATGNCQHLISMIQKKLQKHKSLEQIADDLETTPEEISPLYEIIRNNPEKSKEEIYRLFKDTHPQS